MIDAAWLEQDEAGGHRHDPGRRNTCASFILRIRSHSHVNNRYLRHVLNFMRSEGVFSGSSRMQINHKLNAAEFSAFLVRVPPSLHDQERIADVLDRAEITSRKLNAEANDVGSSASNLRAAILRNAFAAEL